MGVVYIQASPSKRLSEHAGKLTFHSTPLGRGTHTQVQGLEVRGPGRGQGGQWSWGCTIPTQMRRLGLRAYRLLEQKKAVSIKPPYHS